MTDAHRPSPEGDAEATSTSGDPSDTEPASSPTPRRLTSSWVAGVVFWGVALALVLAGVNFSSFGAYGLFLPENLAAVDAPSLGTDRTVRSDEWLVESVRMFSQFHNRFGGVNHAYGPYPVDQSMVASLFTWSVVSLGKPFAWGFPLLGLERGYAWWWVMQYATALFFGYLLLRRWRLPRWAAAGGAFVVTYSPGLQWWTLTYLWAAFLALVYLLVTINDPVAGRNGPAPLWLRVTRTAGAVVASGAFALVVYPPIQVPLVWIGVAAVVGTYVARWRQDRDAFTRRHLTRGTAALAAAYVLAVGALLAVFLVGVRDTLARVGATVYPGLRRDLGGSAEVASLWYPYTAFVTGWRPTTFENASELAVYLTLLPAPLLVWALRRRELPLPAVGDALALVSVVLLGYAYVGLGPLATVLGLSMSTGARSLVPGTFAQTLLLLVLLGIPGPRRPDPDPPGAVGAGRAAAALAAWRPGPGLARAGVVGAATGLLCALGPVVAPQVVAYVGGWRYALLSVGFVGLAGALALGWRSVVVAGLVCATALTGATVNPVRLGIAPMTDTPLAVTVRALQAERPGAWVTVGDDFVVAKYLLAQGVPVVNGLNYPPQLEQWRRLDPDGRYADAYNRYAHVKVELTDGPASFELQGVDLMVVHVPTDDLPRLGVSYVLSRTDVTAHATAAVRFEPAAPALPDGVRIWRVVT